MLLRRSVRVSTRVRLRRLPFTLLMRLSVVLSRRCRRRPMMPLLLRLVAWRVILSCRCLLSWRVSRVICRVTRIWCRRIRCRLFIRWSWVSRRLNLFSIWRRCRLKMVRSLILLRRVLSTCPWRIRVVRRFRLVMRMLMLRRS